MSHWYNTLGEPVYKVNRSDGKGTRPTTLRDAKKLNLVPSVTTIISLLDKPALVNWKIDQILNEVIKNNFNPELNLQISEETFEEFIDKWKKIVKFNAEKISRDSAEFGNQIHDGIEKFIKLNSTLDKQVDLFVQGAISLLISQIGQRKSWISEKSIYHALGFGGKVDLHGENFVLDFKTKNTDDFNKPLAYETHCMQLAAYRMGLDMPNAKCYNLFISSVKPGLVKLYEWKEEEIQKGWEMFKCLLKYWQLSNGVLNEF